MQTKESNKSVGASSDKGSKKEKEYTFPKYNIKINAISPEEARKKLDKELNKQANKGDNDKKS